VIAWKRALELSPDPSTGAWLRKPNVNASRGTLASQAERAFHPALSGRYNVPNLQEQLLATLDDGYATWPVN